MGSLKFLGGSGTEKDGAFTAAGWYGSGGGGGGG
jgi:hypothetical protein